MPGQSGDEFDEARAFIRREVVARGVASLAVAVARDGAIVWEEGFGWADRERRLPADAHTPYSLASISKPITATALMVLVERGLVDLDRPINDELGATKVQGRAWDAAGATVRRVANHTSGLPLHYHFFPADEPHRRPPMDETIRRYANLVSAPGERYQYSNLGYGLLDEVIARRANRDYAAFMRREVFLPLDMTRSSVDIGPGLELYAAARYGHDGQRLPFYYDFDHPGGSAVFASAHDLVRFGMFHLGQRLPEQRAILSDASRAAMQESTASIDTNGGYGIGWRSVEHAPGRRTIEHDGGMMGVATTLLLVPAERLVIVALCNSADMLPHEAADHLLQPFAPDIAAARAAARARRQAEQAQPAPPFQPPRELRGTWRGAVAAATGATPLTLKFKDDGDVHAQLGNQWWTLVNEPRLADGWLSGVFSGDLAADPTLHGPYDLHLDLKLRGDVLNGALIAKTLPDVWVGDALSHWTELRHTGET